MSVCWSHRSRLQEALLSLRRLVFAPDQVYLESSEMRCCESRLVNRDLLHGKNKECAKKRLRPGIVAGGRTYVPQSKPNPFNQEFNRDTALCLLTIKHTSRLLSREQDFLDAFVGISNYITHTTFCYATSGVWILPRVAPCIRHRK